MRQEINFEELAKKVDSEIEIETLEFLKNLEEKMEEDEDIFSDDEE